LDEPVPFALDAALVLFFKGEAMLVFIERLLFLEKVGKEVLPASKRDDEPVVPSPPLERRLSDCSGRFTGSLLRGSVGLSDVGGGADAELLLLLIPLLLDFRAAKVGTGFAFGLGFAGGFDFKKSLSFLSETANVLAEPEA
jgi:hypothetical protein